MFEELNAHRQAVQENIRKAFEVGFTGNEDLEKAYQVGDEATDKHGVTYYVHALNAAGKPLWRKKKDSGAKATNSGLTEQEKKEKSFLESAVRSGHRLSQRDANRLYALQRKERQAVTTADKPGTLKDAPKTEKPGQQQTKMKVDDTTIDQTEYDKAYKTAISATETEEHLKSSLAKIEENIKTIKDALANASDVTAGKLQNMLTASVSKKKAIEDALKANKKSAKVDVPYENLKTINETIAYAKTLSDFTFKREKSDYISDGGKKFSLTNKNGLKMTVDFVNDSEYVYNFKDKYGNILYHNSSTNYNSRTNWKDLFNPKTWSSERISALESNISKYEKASRSAKMRYDRSGKSSDYQKYVNNDIWAKNLITVLKGVKKIAELS